MTPVQAGSEARAKGSEWPEEQGESVFLRKMTFGDHRLLQHGDLFGVENMSTMSGSVIRMLGSAKFANSPMGS